jgi:hypothetical protein
MTQHAVFTSIGLVTTTQEVAASALEAMPDADPELVAEETLCLISVAAARTIQSLTGEDTSLAGAVMAAPFLYRDYMIGSAMLAAEGSVGEAAGVEVGRRLEKKMAFYSSHLQAERAPGDAMIREKMLLWMGRISPPKMPDSPEARLERIDAADRVSRFVRLVAAHVRHGQQPARPSDDR